ncbi:DMT family transporter [Caulobacter sp. NIBR2454]|uniref:DMT family transporter n=1 Tax=Caulobacter sp. NIBR2454 TaxID=3015996 RepID=UPI0022B6C6F9|nr:EamA family transporter [Caulobacter sp. NIBR2454]
MSRTSSPFTLVEVGAIATIILVWGVNNAAAKVATAELPPLFVAGFRFLIALVVLLPLLRPPFPDLRRMWPIVILSGPIHFAFVYIGFGLAEQLSPLVVASQLWIPFTVLFAWRVLGERMTRAAALGLAVAFAGVTWMTLDPHTATDFIPIVLIITGAAIWALATVLVRRLPSVRPLKMQALTSLVAAPLLLGAAFGFEPNLKAQVMDASPLAWACVVFAGLASSIGASSLLFWLVQRREPSRVTPFFLLTPLVSCTIGILLMGDKVTVQLIGGGMATLAGVAIVTFDERRRARLAALQLQAASQV